MATRARVDAHLKADLKLFSGGQPAELSPPHASRNRRLRRIITREQGRALETIGHAVDYLSDCYLHQGADDEVLNFISPALEAARVLIAARNELLAGLPLRQPITTRLWHALLRRRSPLKSSAVVPLSSSR